MNNFWIQPQRQILDWLRPGNNKQTSGFGPGGKQQMAKQMTMTNDEYEKWTDTKQTTTARNHCLATVRLSLWQVELICVEFLIDTCLIRQLPQFGTDESTHQILSYGLPFSTFYHFPYTADPLTSTAPMRPSLTIAWTFAQSPPTIPYTHHTISPVPCWRPPIWPTDHVVIFSFLSLFPFTQCILSRPNRSQVIAPCDWDFTICFAAHKPCAHFTYHLYLRLLYLLQKTRKFSPELRL